MNNITHKLLFPHSVPKMRIDENPPPPGGCDRLFPKHSVTYIPPFYPSVVVTIGFCLILYEYLALWLGGGGNISLT